MRIHRLEIEGFGPFLARQVVDFDALAADGIFLITGRTGAGKSSVLDAICFALYGSVPRYGGARPRLRSDHAAPEDRSEVVLEFSVRDERYRVTRRPEYERPKRRGQGMTTSPHEAVLERADGTSEDGWSGVAARPVDVGLALEPVLQLSRDQFLQVVLLAQNRFQEFLRAKSEDRQALLRALFGTQRFGEVEEALRRRERQAAESVADRGRALAVLGERLAEETGSVPPDGPLAAWARDVAERSAARAGIAARALREAEDARATAERDLAAAVRTRDLQERRSGARAALESAAARSAERAAVRAELRAAERAESVRADVEAAEAAVVATRAATAAQAAAAAVAPVVDEPAARVASLTELLGGLAGAAAVEAGLTAVRADAAGAEAALAAAVAALAALETSAAALPAERERLLAARAAAAAAADRLPAAELALTAATATRSAAERATELAARLDAARRVEADEGVADARAAARLADLLRQRVDGAAGDLAGRLRPDEPCPVCGALEHPRPADAAQSIDDAAITRAEGLARAAREVLDAARGRAAEVASALADARAAAGGRTVPDADADVATAAAERSAAARAARELGTLDDDLARAERDLGSLAADARAAGDAVDAARRLAVETAARLRADAARVDEARQDAATVRARVAAVLDERARLQRLVDASAATALARIAEQREATRLAAALRLAGLADAATARTALRPAAWREEAGERIRAQDLEVEVARSTLADPDVAAAPEEPADTSAAARAQRESIAERDAAVAADLSATAVARTASALAARIAREEPALEAEASSADRIRSLARSVRGEEPNSRRMRLESYVLAARLEQIVDAANARFSAMTLGRFSLAHDDAVAYGAGRAGLGLAVLDEFTGHERATHSLSGGETFLASLSLALGLAEIVTAEAGGVRLDTLFVDEGFGSLDRETLDIAMATLDSLRAGGRVVGLISHVEAMQEDVPAGLHVERTPIGPSTVRLRTGVSATA